MNVQYLKGKFPRPQLPLTSISKQLLNCTLECSDIVSEIMSFFSDEEFTENFENYMKSFPKATKDASSFLNRKVIHCKTFNQIGLFCQCLQNVPIMKSEIDMEVSFFESKHVSMIEKFQVVHLNGVSISDFHLVELINKGSSKVQHLKFTNFAFGSTKQKEIPRVLEITPYLRKLTFCKTEDLKFNNFLNINNFITSKMRRKEERERVGNPMLDISKHIRFGSSNVDEIEFLTEMSSHDLRFLSNIGHKLTKLNILNQSLPSDWHSRIVPNLEHVWLDSLPCKLVNSTNMHLTYGNGDGPGVPGNNVKKITIGSNDFVLTGIGEVLCKLQNSFPKCEELVLPETFAESLSFKDVEESLDSKSLKKIVIQHYMRTPISKLGCLKFALQLLFSHQVQITYENLDETSTSLPDNRKMDQKDNIYKRIESLEQHFKAMDNSIIREKIKETKISFCTCFISNNFCRLYLIEDTLNTLDNLRRNKFLMLETMHQAFQNYNDIFTDDSLYLSTIEKYNECIESLNNENANDQIFSNSYSELEQFFHKMIRVVEENNYPPKVLFNEQWFNDQIVEIYYGTGDVHVCEDSEEEMERALFEIDIESNECMSEEELLILLEESWNPINFETLKV